MDFALTDEQQEHRDHARRFAREVIRPVARKHDEEESTPWEVLKEARRWGLQGVEHMQKMGTDPGGQLGVITAEELHWGCAGIALAIQGSGLAAAGIAASGTPEQIAEWVPQCFGTDDEIALGAYAVTEPQAGSDVKSLKTTAKLDGDEWVLNGTKVFITNGGIADVHVVVATVDPELGHRGQASFVVGKGTPGLEQGKKESKIGIRASHTAEVILEDCRIPVENLLGGMDKLNRKLERARSGQKAGSSNALATFEMTRPIVGASALGIAQAAYEWTLEYLSDQTVDGGKPALEEQRIQQVLADVATEIDSARLLVQRAAWMGRNGVPMTGGQGSMSKLKAGDVTMWATTTLMELVGPYAQTTDCPLEKWFRDAKIYQLFEGTAQVQRLVISRMQARAYQERFAAAAEVARQAVNGSGNGSVIGSAGRVVPSRGRVARAATVVSGTPPRGVQPLTPMTRSKLFALALSGALIVCACALWGGSASGQSLQQRLNSTQNKLSHVRAHAGVLTGRISHESTQLQQLTSEVAALRNKEAEVAAQLRQKQAELEQAQARLDYLKQRLREAIQIFEQRLVAIYESNQPDLITVILQSHGFDDLIARTQYLQDLQSQDNDIVARVRNLRNQMQVTVNTVRSARDEIAARKQELEVTKAKLKQRTTELATARRKQHGTLMRVRKQQDDLEGDLSDISQKIAEQLAAGAGALPAGPVRGGGHGLIWPVSGPITSGYGARNIGSGYEFHPGVDIGVPTGTPIRAAASGTVSIAGPEGGYGNYTCIDHGGGLSTCYGHQERILVSVGQEVAQAQIIGLSDCTGYCFGPHVHFEVRINGQTTDPLAYL